MKKLLAVVLCLMVSVSLFAAAEEKSDFTPLKDKLSLGFNFSAQEVSLRLWPTDSIGVQATAGFQMYGNSMSFGLGGGMVIPMKEKGSLAFNLIPGLKFNYANSWGTRPVTDIKYSDSTIDFMGGAEFEVALLLSAISDKLSIASGIGFWLGVNIESHTEDTTTTSETHFVLDLAKSIGVKVLEIRYYF